MAMFTTKHVTISTSKKSGLKITPKNQGKKSTTASAKKSKRKS